MGGREGREDIVIVTPIILGHVVPSSLLDVNNQLPNCWEVSIGSKCISYRMTSKSKAIVNVISNERTINTTNKLFSKYVASNSPGVVLPIRWRRHVVLWWSIPPVISGGYMTIVPVLL